ncbi:nucleoside diphosphate-linked moiety X motif 13 isoform X2 [Xiphophorus maculatus]|uniref:NAD(+) diphosphatase n=4 Tax=Xiphophorus maculatus TaxID=8083 RepID=A0A3B5QN04_XIPMA|nr:nucleoside diphosphate-linked moiety X motif 13 isoform X2 [Xiphophorus maculatus]XP_027882943.1 nucleoside diphosphate-linked moiety X motif 13 isoform X1 [Xiphophorus couchianus]XP_027882944.1 nucleoside diphosphate-linked moiety X motif 13 isoform X1 [Xiphophorus couchianus]XP_027882945.1 nucleoside diphosphate-linked moiety X motif 13 isoform X1 [Xiphophorus couchianus]XP_027882946.1 nucleoside diphosphate-linked moiety X motif 13 isoform X1 [Xiphophorus couchianus]XP_027882947.1 nucleo
MIQSSMSALRPLRTLLFGEHYSLTRFCSGFVSRMRYINRLKENDAACLSALQNGHIFLFHRLIPLLQCSDPETFRPIALTYSEVQSVLHKCGSDGSLLKESILIGCSEQNHAQFCLDVGELDPAAIAQNCKGTFMDLRKAFFLLEGAEAPLVAKAQALLQWHQINRFCGATGQLTQRNQAGSQRACSSSSIVYYPKMSPVVIVLVSDGKRCLLGRQSSFPRGLYSALAGFCDMGETLEEALRREVAEEVGLEVQNIIYSSSQHWPFPHSSFMLACHATVSPAHSQLNVDHLELEDARWFTEEEITCALQVKAPPWRDHRPAVWLPPKHAVAHRLIMEWREQQHSQDTE